MAMSPTLVDQYGRPVRRAELVKTLARPGISSVRQTWAPSVASGLTPQRMAAIMRAAAQDDPHDYLVLAEEMEERDPHYASVLGVRKRAVSGIAPMVQAASDSARDREIAEAVRIGIAEHDQFADLVEDLMDGVGKGFAVVEIDWAKSASAWAVRCWTWRDPRHFRWDRDTGSELRLLSEAQPAGGEMLEPYKFAVHRPRLKSGLAMRGGIARLVAFGWLCKAYTVKDWIAFIECYGLPLRLGRYGPEATVADVTALHRAVANIGTDAAAVLPRSMEIEFQEIGDGAGNDIFEKLARWVDEQTSKAVLGQTMTSDNGSSQSQASVHNEVRHDVLRADARQIAGTINRDIVRPFVDLNYGPQPDYPRLEFPIAEPEDIKELVVAVNTLARLGVRFRADELRGKLGLSAPEEGDETIGGTSMPETPAAPAAPPRIARAPNSARSCACAACVERAANESEPDPYDDLDAAEIEALSTWPEQLAPMIDPILALVDEAQSYEELRRRLPELLGQMQPAQVIDGLVGALVQARAAGDLAR